MADAGAFTGRAKMLSACRQRPLRSRLVSAAGGFGLSVIAAACSSGSTLAVAEGSEHIACALGAGAAFTPACAVERAGQDGEKLLVVRHPDGGFRRFIVRQDGLGLAAADGAAIAQVGIADDLLEVTVALDRYRFPFRMKGNASY